MQKLGVYVIVGGFDAFAFAAMMQCMMKRLEVYDAINAAVIGEVGEEPSPSHHCPPQIERSSLFTLLLRHTKNSGF